MGISSSTGFTTATSIMRGKIHPPIGGTFSTVISLGGEFYKITVVTPDGIITDFQDSFEEDSSSVASMAKTHTGLRWRRGRWITRRCVIPATFPTPEEVRYVRKDVRIVAEVLRHQYEGGS